MIPKIDRIFATHTIPRVGKSDNDPPFASDEIKVHMEEKEIKHSQITPLGPQANSEAENFMKVKLAKGSRFLLNYRATPHSTSGFVPSEPFNRKIKAKLHQLSMKRNSDIDWMVQKNDEQRRE